MAILSYYTRGHAGSVDGNIVRQQSGLFLMDLEIGYKVFFLMNSSSTDIAIHDSG